MSTSRGPSVRQRRLAAELRRLRERRGLTGDEVAERLTWSTAKVSRIENARTGAKISDVRRLLELYEIDGARHEDLIALAHDAAQRGWWEEYRDLPSPLANFIALESEAGTIRQWEGNSVPGLLQTRRYARRVIEGYNDISTIPPQEIDRRVEVRIRRQEVLYRQQPPQLVLIVDEAVLKRRVGNDEMMREQLDRMLFASGLPQVTLRILPLDAPRRVMADSFTILEFPATHDVTFPDIVHTESITISHLVDESVTYMYRLAHNSLASQALSPTETRQRIIEARALW
ncbi:helix-turn-helix domain-containing protein [Actinomadura formosensis]|uniref:helix-turn-helix domain-containing protein n=1 Tax=Actinomadura formosensis TaxID=60706 RepID=UPI003D8F13F3